MTTTDKLHLGFGYNAGLPDNATFAFGARLIVTQDGAVDFLADRTSIVFADSMLGDDAAEFAADRMALLDKLEAEYPLSDLKADVSAALKTGRLGTRGYNSLEAVAGDFTMKANCQASAGYCYVVVFLTADA